MLVGVQQGQVLNVVCVKCQGRTAKTVKSKRTPQQILRRAHDRIPGLLAIHVTFMGSVM